MVGRPFNGPEVEAFVKRNDVFLFFETPFDWSFLDFCRRRGKKTIIVPMYECALANPPFLPDKWICPSLLDVQYFPGSPFLPIPVDPSKWKLRTRARRFLHNAGNIGLREHKGTRQILESLKHIKGSVDFTVRSQDTAGLKKILDSVYPWKTWKTENSRFEIHCGLNKKRISIEFGQRDYDTLFDGYDVFVMAEKYNGLSLPLQEARAAGMGVMTSNRFSMNTWLPNELLIPVKGYTRQRVGGPYNWYDEAEVDPKEIAKKIDEIYDTDLTVYSEQGKMWAEGSSWKVWKPIWLEEIGK